MLDFIVNKKAGNGSPIKAMNKIKKILDEKNIEYTFHLTEERHHATKIVKELCEQGADNIIAVGGDGTINEVLNGITNFERVKMGIIPCGNGNDFISTAKIPLNVEKALNVVINGVTKPTDFMDCDGIRGLNIIGAGIDVEILQRCERNKFLKGKIKYLVSLIVSLFKFKFYNLQVKQRDEYQQKSALIVCAGNGKCFGGGISICPDAEVDDGYMDFVIVDKMKKSLIPKTFRQLMKHKIMDCPYYNFSRQTDIDVVFDKPTPIQIDGEIYENLKFKIKLEKNKLNLYRP